MRETSLLAILVLLAASGCASGTKARVVKTEGDALNSIATAKEEPDARLEAIEAAQQYCEQKGRSPVFREQGLHRENKGTGLDLENLPVIRKVFKGDDKDQVVLSFRCEAERRG